MRRPILILLAAVSFAVAWSSSSSADSCVGVPGISGNLALCGRGDSGGYRYFEIYTQGNIARPDWLYGATPGYSNQVQILIGNTWYTAEVTYSNVTDGNQYYVLNWWGGQVLFNSPQLNLRIPQSAFEPRTEDSQNADGGTQYNGSDALGTRSDGCGFDQYGRWRCGGW